MRIALSDLEHEIRGTGNNTMLVPIYLQAEERNKVLAYIQFLEKNLGRKKSEVLFKIVEDLFPSYKIIKSLNVSSARFYSYSSKSTDEIIGVRKTKEPKKTSSDITSFIADSVSNKNAISSMTPAQFRSKVYEIVNKKQNGFVNNELREKIVSEIEQNLGIPTSILDKLLYRDIDSERVLLKNENIDPLQLIRYFNYDTIETILCFSIDFQMRIKKLPGYLAKKVIYLSKKNYVFTDIVLEEDGYKITIHPPLELYTEQGGWGKNIANVATYILRVLLREEIAFQINAVVKPRNRKVMFSLNSSELLLLPTFKADEDDGFNFRPEIDSKVENQFLKSWRNYHGWKATPEPEAIIIGKKMYVPDFLLQRGKKTLYLEIVGFYTIKYILKKKKQMEELDKVDIPIIYVIDENLKPHFTEKRKINHIFYVGTRIPNNELSQLLEKHHSDFEERLPVFQAIITEVGRELDKSKKSITLNDLDTRFNAYSTDETTKILSSSEVDRILKEFNIIFLTSYGLVHSEVFETVRKHMKSIGKSSLLALKDQFPDFKEALIAICQHIGCAVKWKSIDEVEISLD